MQSSNRSIRQEPISEALPAVGRTEGAFGEDDRSISAVNGTDRSIERREHPRGGVVTVLEDITYGVLRHTCPNLVVTVVST